MTFRQWFNLYKWYAGSDVAARAEWIREMIFDCGLTQKTLADYFGWPQSQIARYVAGTKPQFAFFVSCEVLREMMKEGKK